MAEQPFNGEPGDEDEHEPVEDDDAIEGTVVQFPGRPAPTPATPPRKPPFGQPGELRDIIPAGLRSWASVKKALKRQRKLAKHHTLYHAVRSPKRLTLTIWWAGVGLARLAAAQIAWWWVSEQTYLRHEAVAANDAPRWLQLHNHARKTRLVRGMALAAEVLGVFLACGIITSYAPLAWIPVLAVVIPLLAWVGRPADKPILDSAVTPTHIERLSKEIIIRALGTLGISELNKAIGKDPDHAVVWSTRFAGTATAGWPAPTSPTASPPPQSWTSGKNSPPGCAGRSAACGPRRPETPSGCPEPVRRR